MKKFKKGRLVNATVEEVLHRKELIVSIEGQLFRVKNTTHKIFKKDDFIQLCVASDNPLKFQLFQPAGHSYSVSV